MNSDKNKSGKQSFQINFPLHEPITVIICTCQATVILTLNPVAQTQKPFLKTSCSSFDSQPKITCFCGFPSQT